MQCLEKRKQLTPFSCSEAHVHSYAVSLRRRVVGSLLTDIWPLDRPLDIYLFSMLKEWKRSRSVWKTQFAHQWREDWRKQVTVWKTLSHLLEEGDYSSCQINVGFRSCVVRDPTSEPQSVSWRPLRPIAYLMVALAGWAKLIAWELSGGLSSQCSCHSSAVLLGFPGLKSTKQVVGLAAIHSASLKNSRG